MSIETTALILAWAAILILAFAMAGLLRQIHFLRQGLHPERLRAGPKIGEPALSLGDVPISSGRPTALVFVDNKCQTCRRIMPELSGLAAQTKGDLQLMLLFREEADGSRDYGISVLENQREAFARYRVPLTPFAVLVTRDGLIAAAEPLGSPEAVRIFAQRVGETLGELGREGALP